MKKTLSILLILTLVISFAACQKKEKALPETETEVEQPAVEEPVAEEPATEEAAEDELPELKIIKLDKSKIEYFDEISYQEPTGLSEGGHIDESYIIITSGRYEDFSRDFVSYLPKFNEEITLGGGEKIKKHYAEEYKKEEARKEEVVATMFEDELIDSPAQKQYIDSRDYSLNFVDKYLTVASQYYSYYGGAHPSHRIIFENFDMSTGELLKLSDVVELNDKTMALFELKIAETTAASGQSLFQTDDLKADLKNMGDINYYFNETGISLFFNEYDISPYSEGSIFVEIPFTDLSGSLKIEV